MSSRRSGLWMKKTVLCIPDDDETYWTPTVAFSFIVLDPKTCPNGCSQAVRIFIIMLQRKAVRYRQILFSNGEIRPLRQKGLSLATCFTAYDISGSFRLPIVVVIIHVITCMRHRGNMKASASNATPNLRLDSISSLAVPFAPSAKRGAPLPDRS